MAPAPPPEAVAGAVVNLPQSRGRCEGDSRFVQGPRYRSRTAGLPRKCADWSPEEKRRDPGVAGADSHGAGLGRDVPEEPLAPLASLGRPTKRNWLNWLPGTSCLAPLAWHLLPGTCCPAPLVLGGRPGSGRPLLRRAPGAWLGLADLPDRRSWSIPRGSEARPALLARHFLPGPETPHPPRRPAVLLPRTPGEHDDRAGKPPAPLAPTPHAERPPAPLSSARNPDLRAAARPQRSESGNPLPPPPVDSVGGKDAPPPAPAGVIAWHRGGRPRTGRCRGPGVADRFAGSLDCVRRRLRETAAGGSAAAGASRRAWSPRAPPSSRIRGFERRDARRAPPSSRTRSSSSPA